MAEIRIVRKDAGRRRVLWILPLLLLLALIPWYFLRQRGAEPVATTDTTLAVAGGAVDTTAQASAPALPDASSAVNEYARFVAAGQPEMADTAQLRYASDGLVRLAGAIEALAAPNATPTLTAALTTMRQQAAQLPTALGTEPTHMEIAKPAFAAASTALVEVQRIRKAGDVGPAVKIAGTIASRGTLRSQREKIQTFFDQTSTALQTVMETPGITPGPDSLAKNAHLDSLKRLDSLRMERVKAGGGPGGEE